MATPIYQSSTMRATAGATTASCFGASIARGIDPRSPIDPANARATVLDRQAMLPVQLAAPTAVVAAAPAAVGPAAEAVPRSEPAGPAEPETKPRYRNGLVVGLSLGVGIGRGAGYPNNSNDIGNPAFRSASGWMFGSGETLTIMGALADYLNFGIMLTGDSFRGNGQRAVQSGFGLRVEAFPLVGVCPRLSGLGLLAQFGVGIGRLTTPGLPQAGGTQSYIGTGAFYEWAFGHVLGGHFAAGPALEYDAMFSHPYDQNGIVALGRIVFYGGP